MKKSLELELELSAATRTLLLMPRCGSPLVHMDARSCDWLMSFHSFIHFIFFGSHLGVLGGM